MKNSLSFGPAIIITIVLSLKEGVQLNLQFTFDPKSMKWNSKLILGMSIHVNSYSRQ